MLTEADGVEVTDGVDVGGALVGGVGADSVEVQATVAIMPTVTSPARHAVSPLLMPPSLPCGQGKSGENLGNDSAFPATQPSSAPLPVA